MNRVDFFLEQFATESAGTRKALEAVPEEKFDFRPHDRSWTLRELSSHLAEVPEWLAGIVTTDEIDMAGGFDYQPFVAADKTELLTRYEAAVAQVPELMGGLTEEQQSAVWTIRAGDHVMLSAPRMDVIHSTLIHHAIHHRGQLTVYLRLCGVPVPGLYGPSADEK